MKRSLKVIRIFDEILQFTPDSFTEDFVKSMADSLGHELTEAQIVQELNDRCTVRDLFKKSGRYFKEKPKSAKAEPGKASMQTRSGKEIRIGQPFYTQF